MLVSSSSMSINMERLIDLFDVWYGVNLEVVNSEVVKHGIPFVSRKSVDNGVVCEIKRIDGLQPNPKNTISIAVSGSVLSTFYHEYEYYSGRDVYVAKPKIPMDKQTLLFYCYAIEQNKYRYNYGRGANKTFKDLMLPSLHEIPEWVSKVGFTSPNRNPVNPKKAVIDTSSWNNFFYDDIFEIQKGFYNKKPESHTGTEYPFIGAIDNNNGVSELYSINDIQEASKIGDGKNEPLESKLFEGNCITVSNNGSVGYAFYQPKKFTCTHDVNPLYINPKWGIKMNPYIAMFLCTIIELEQYRWAYGRKWRPKRMPKSIIKLPVDSNGNPDWQFMEDYIKSLPYSKNL